MIFSPPVFPVRPVVNWEIIFLDLYSKRDYATNRLLDFREQSKAIICLKRVRNAAAHFSFFFLLFRAREKTLARQEGRRKNEEGRSTP
jgi:hypothetical protein